MVDETLIYDPPSVFTQGFVRGKLRGEKAVRETFGSNATIVGPTLVLGGGRFDTVRAVLALLLSSLPVKAYNSALRWIKVRGG